MTQEKEDKKPPFGDTSDEKNDSPGKEETDAPSAEDAPPADASQDADDAGAASPADTAKDDSPDDAAAEPAAKLEAEVADLKDKLLRALAETENVRRRAQRDQEDANKYAVASFAREMVEVRDNLRRALDAVDDEMRKSDDAVAGLLEGVEMTEKTLLATFERFGITPIEALHQQFDHNLHEALFEIEDASVPSGTVVQEVQTGYKIHDRLLRPSKVGVSKGGAKIEAAADKPEDAGEAAAEAPSKKSSKAYEHTDPGSGAQIDEEL